MRVAVLLLALIFSAVTHATATGPFLVEGGLMVAVTKGDIRGVEELLYGNVINSRVLGRALLKTLTQHSTDYERRALRLSQLLLAKGADVDYSEADGRTPLMEACRKRFETVVEGLLVAGADLRARDVGGNDVWDYLDQAGGDVSMVLWAINKADTARRQRMESSNVRNLRAYIRDGIVVVHYDLDASGPVPVMLLGSDNNGRTYSLKVQSVRGHVGEEVAPGRDREIIWAVGDDYPRGKKPREITLDVVIAVN